MSHETTGTKKIGRYELVKIIGRGAMGVVYQAILHGPSGFQKTVALKLIDNPLLEQNFRQDLINEARFGGLLKHPNVVETYELGEVDEKLFIAMEYVDGPSLESLRRKYANLPPQAVLDIVCHLCQGLSHIHGLKVRGKPMKLVHRDLKPSNVLIDHNGLVKIADFGLARSFDADNDEDSIRGTPSYMSPEQVAAEPLDGRSDIFALGLILYELLTGERLFSSHNPYATMAQIRNITKVLETKKALVEIKKISTRLADIVEKCLQFSPQDRFHSAGELRQNLRQQRRFSGMDLYSLIQVETKARSSQNISMLHSTTDHWNEKKSFQPELIGRELELQKLNNHLTAGDFCVAITGSAGVGKSSLTRALLGSTTAQQRVVFYVDCRSCEEVIDVLVEMVNSFQNPATVTMDLEDLVRSIANQSSIFLLDHVGHLLELYPFLVQRIKQLEKCTFVLTANHNMGLEKKYCIELSSLPEEQAVLVLKGMLQRSLKTVRLGQEQLLSMVKELAGNPLAMLVAVKQMDGESLRVSLRQLLRKTLKGENNPLYDSARRCWRLLQPEQQQYLKALSLFQGRFSTLAATRVLGVESAETDLQELCLTSVLSKTSQGNEFGFIMCSIFNAFILENKEVDKPFISRFCGFYGDMLSPVFSSVQSIFTEQQLANHLMAIGFSIENRWDDWAVKNSLIASEYYIRFGPFSRGFQLLKRVKATTLNPTVFAHVASVLARYYLLLGQSLSAMAEYRSALLRLPDNKSETAFYVTIELINTTLVIGDVGHGEKIMQESEALQENTILQQAHLATVKSRLALELLQLDRAERLLLSCFGVLQKFHDHLFVLRALLIWAQIKCRQNNYERATYLLRKALRVAQQQNLPQHTKQIWAQMIIVAWYERQWDKGRLLFSRLEGKRGLSQSTHYLAVACTQIGRIAVFQERYVEAKQFLDKALLLLKNMQSPLCKYNCLQGLALLEEQEGNLQKSRVYQEQAYKLVVEMNIGHKLVESSCYCAHALYQENQPELAAIYLQSAQRRDDLSVIEHFWIKCAETAQALHQVQYQAASLRFKQAEKMAINYRGIHEVQYQLQLLSRKISASH